MKKLESSWKEGIWLRHCERSNETLIGTERGVIRTWAIKRRSEDERWDISKIENMQGTPKEPIPGRAGTQIPIRVGVEFDDVDVPDAPHPLRQEEAPRRVYLQKRHFLKHRFSDNCEGCRRSRAGDAVTHRAHSEQCRRRMYEAMAMDEEDQRYLEHSRRRFEAHAEEACQAAGIDVPAGEQRPAGLLPQANRSHSGMGEDNAAEINEDRFFPHASEADGAARDAGDNAVGGEERSESSEANAQLLNMFENILRGADITEIYSPKRILREAEKF
ncbi:hypothetical protein N9L68_07960 [bacterium]|nr:hypothetical protein [bacterium]